MDKNLTIIIATYNRSESLNNCLLSLTKQTDPNFSVLIIDGGSNDNTRNIIEKYKDKLLINAITDKTPNLAYIRDLGWRKAKTDLVAWVDDDTIVENKWVRSIKNAFKRNNLKSSNTQTLRIGGLTGPTIIPSKLLNKRDVFYCHRVLENRQKNLSIDKFFCKLYFRLFMQGEKYRIGKIYPSGAWSPGSNFPHSRKLKKPIEVDYLEACNFAVRREVLEEIGGFDISYKDASEWCEVDLAFRIRKAGYKLIFDPKIAVQHHVSQSGVYSRRLPPLSRLKNFLLFYTKTYYPKSAKGWILFILYLQSLLVYYFYIWIKRRLF